MTIEKYKQSLREPLRQRTLCFLIWDRRVLLGKKKRGFGQGYWLGIGGKVEESENLEQAAIREVEEEIGVTPNNINRVATLNFYFPNVENSIHWNQQVCVFTANSWQGEIHESDEIFPQWFDIDKVPLDLMWDDASYWLPNILQGQKLIGDFLFSDTIKVKEYKIYEK